MILDVERFVNFLDFNQVVVSDIYIFYFHPEIFGEDEPILTYAYFSKGLVETTN